MTGTCGQSSRPSREDPAPAKGRGAGLSLPPPQRVAPSGSPPEGPLRWDSPVGAMAILSSHLCYVCRLHPTMLAQHPKAQESRRVTRAFVSQNPLVDPITDAITRLPASVEPIPGPPPEDVVVLAVNKVTTNQVLQLANPAQQQERGLIPTNRK